MFLPLIISHMFTDLSSLCLQQTAKNYNIKITTITINKIIAANFSIEKSEFGIDRATTSGKALITSFRSFLAVVATSHTFVPLFFVVATPHTIFQRSVPSEHFLRKSTIATNEAKKIASRIEIFEAIDFWWLKKVYLCANSSRVETNCSFRNAR